MLRHLILPFFPLAKSSKSNLRAIKINRDGREYEALGIFDHVFQEHHQHQFGAVVATECAEAQECVGFLGYLNLNAAFLQHPVTVKFRRYFSSPQDTDPPNIQYPYFQIKQSDTIGLV